MNITRTTITALTAATALLTAGCELQPGQPAHITINELDAYWMHPTPPTQLWVEMITEGDFKDRCVANFGGVMYNDSRGFICEIGPRPTTTP